jgi:hypothetical protein
MTNFPTAVWRFVVLGLSLMAAGGLQARAAHQTDTTSPIVIGGELPYRLLLRTVDYGQVQLPTLHSFARAEWNGKWVLLGGRTNGLHGFDGGGLQNFPPAYQNREIWVIDPVAKTQWHRSLTDSSSALSQRQIDSLSTTNMQFYQDEDRLYFSGGYGFDTTERFITYDTLTAIDLPELIAWAQGGAGGLEGAVRQLSDPLFQVTGGYMGAIEDRAHLIFGQNFQGGYVSGRNGVYTNQVRSFTIQDDGTTLSIAQPTVSPPDPNYRRRDFNVAPMLARGAGGEIVKSWTAFGGVFTETDGAWTVPVEISAIGVPAMADPALPETFRQGMNGYTSARIGLYSAANDEMHNVLLGGISLRQVDRATGEIISDDQLPFINQVTAIVRDASGTYTQYLLDEEFPDIRDDDGNRLRFGTNAEFFPAAGVAIYDNGTLRLDELTKPMTIGYVFGGLMSDSGNGGDTAASSFVFEVVLHPVPEPPTLALFIVGALVAVSSMRLRARRRGSVSPEMASPALAQSPTVAK